MKSANTKAFFLLSKLEYQVGAMHRQGCGKVCVCVCERVRERETDRQTDGDIDGQRQRRRDKDRDRDRKAHPFARPLTHSLTFTWLLFGDQQGGDYDRALEEIRECVKLDGDDKECFSFYKFLKKFGKLAHKATDTLAAHRSARHL